MKISWILLFYVLVGVTPKLYGYEVDPCIRDGREVENNWLLTVNEQGSSTREGLLETLKLLSTKGFAPSFVLSPRTKPSVVIGVVFNPQIFRDHQQAEELKAETLSDLVQIDGNKLECNDISTPGMGIRN